MIAIAAVDRSMGIGFKGGLSWPSQKDDFKHFQETTWNKPIIVGYKTLLTLPKLGNRSVYCLLSGHQDSKTRAVSNEFLAAVQRNNAQIIFDPAECGTKVEPVVCGGASIYQRLIPQCEELFLSVFNFSCESDTQFPFDFGALAEMFHGLEELKTLKNGKVFRYFNSAQ